MNKVLVICGPTATGKTDFGLEMAKEFDGEIVSADSRQVRIGKNEEYGKDLPEGVQYSVSGVRWRDRFLKYYEVGGIKIWLYDVVEESEEFSVAFWKECADLVISNIISRGKLPIVVGGSGLYIRALTDDLSEISLPRIEELRNKLKNKTPDELFDYLKSVNLTKAMSMNDSDRKNPRRLIRAIEISNV